ncbi:hypothetical protein [Glutamicibacter arilaitensis]|uniref:hypothetical protein n=1 Tax=Glutamicibacter arilaitensis TaxID=256701 RepID=UPI00384CCA5D
MRPKLIALIAVSALALAGCGASESTQNVAVQPTAATAEVAESSSALDESGAEHSQVAIEAVEEQFANHVASRSNAYALPVAPKKEKAIEALHDYCESDKPMDLSDTKELNETMESAADQRYCDALETE